jgi:hypothetical protein
LLLLELLLLELLLLLLVEHGGCGTKPGQSSLLPLQDRPPQPSATNTVS